MIDTTLNAGAAYLYTLSNRAVLGDFDGNRLVNENDINLLTSAIFFASSELGFDLDGNRRVDELDRDIYRRCAGYVLW